MSYNQEAIDAYLALQASRRVHDAALSRLEAAYINGSHEQAELAISALLDSSQSIADRLRDLIFIQLIREGIDPITRRSLR